MKIEGKVDAVVALMFVGVFLGLGFLFAAEHYFPNDGQFFQVVAAVVTGFLGTMGARIDPKKGPASPTGVDDPKSSQVTVVTKEVAKDGPA